MISIKKKPGQKLIRNFYASPKEIYFGFLGNFAIVQRRKVDLFVLLIVVNLVFRKTSG